MIQITLFNVTLALTLLRIQWESHRDFEISFLSPALQIGTSRVFALVCALGWSPETPFRIVPGINRRSVKHIKGEAHHWELSWLGLSLDFQHGKAT